MKYDYILVNPPKLMNYEKQINDICLGLGYINAVTRKKNKGMILNAYLNDWNIDETVIKILNAKPEVVGISCNFFSSVPTTVMLVNELRKRNFDGHICLGGHGAVSCKEKLLEYLDINSLALGDGEMSFSTLVDQIVNGTFSNSITGFYYKDGNNVVDKYAEIDFVDIDKLPFPTRPNDYSYPVYNNKSTPAESNIISTTRGCTYNCSYCDISAFYNKKRRIRSVTSVVEEMKYLINLTGLNFFKFSDDNFIGGSPEGRERALEFCNTIKKENLKITFAMEARVTDMTNEILIPLIEAGLIHVNLGVESGCQRMLNTWRKGITVQQSEKAIEKLQTLGLRYNINYILYDMYTTIPELWEVYDFFLRTRIFEFSEDHLSLFDNPLGILAGTPVATQLKKSGLLANYSMKYATKEEQQILNKYQPIFGYDIKDQNMRYFIKNHNCWLDEIRKLIKENSMDFYSISSKNMRFLCLKLFRKSIENAERGEKDKKSLDLLIRKFKSINNLK